MHENSKDALASEKKIQNLFINAAFMHSHKLLVRDEKKVKYRTFRKILNVAICHISVALKINFNHVKGFRDTKSYGKIIFQVVWIELRG